MLTTKLRVRFVSYNVTTGLHRIQRNSFLPSEALRGKLGLIDSAMRQRHQQSSAQ